MSSWWIRGYMRDKSPGFDSTLLLDKNVEDEKAANDAIEKALEFCDEFYVVKTKKRSSGRRTR